MSESRAALVLIGTLAVILLALNCRVDMVNDRLKKVERQLEEAQDLEGDVKVWNIL